MEHTHCFISHRRIPETRGRIITFDNRPIKGQITLQCLTIDQQITF